MSERTSEVDVLFDTICERHPIPVAILSGTVVTIAMLGILEAPVALSAVTIHLQGPSIYPIINQLNSEYLQRLHELAKINAAVSGIIGLYGAFDYRRLLSYGSSNR